MRCIHECDYAAAPCPPSRAAAPASVRGVRVPTFEQFWSLWLRLPVEERDAWRRRLLEEARQAQYAQRDEQEGMHATG